MCVYVCMCVCVINYDRHEAKHPATLATSTFQHFKREPLTRHEVARDYTVSGPDVTSGQRSPSSLHYSPQTVDPRNKSYPPPPHYPFHHSRKTVLQDPQSHVLRGSDANYFREGPGRVIVRLERKKERTNKR